MGVALEALPGLSAAKLIARKLAHEGPHAVLLFGSPGAGQAEVAAYLAQAWVCLSPNSEGACGQCKPCEAFSRGANPDVQFLPPYGKGNQIKLPAITPSKRPLPKEEEPPVIPLTMFSRTPPLMSARKVTILSEIERMNYDAANALLKLLEEPPPYARFILWTSTIGRILPTIVSRCLTVACELPERAAVDARYGELADIYWTAPHLAHRFVENREAYDAMEAFAERLGSAPLVAALRMSDDFRALSGDLGADDGKERVALAEALELFAILVTRRFPGRAAWTDHILEAHRRILGNVNPRSALDALFVELLSL